MPGERRAVTDIGFWSELKLEIIEKYASAYSKILEKQGFYHCYIDAFAGAGQHISRMTGEMVEGSPLVALKVTPPFREYHFIDIEQAKTDHLARLVRAAANAYIYTGDCNSVLLQQVFPRVQYGKRRRALCLIDPYGLHLDWNVIADAGKRGTIEVFLNFPVMDMHMNVLWRKPSEVDAGQAERLTRFWGDRSWREAAYGRQGDFFDYPHKNPIEDVAEAFRKRLREVAGFGYVPEPLPMRTTSNAIVYYLFFASPNNTGARIVRDIFAKYRRHA